MDKLFGSVKVFFKPSKSIIDNHIYRLHYRATVAILIAFSVMITSKQYFGDPIDCISKDDIPPDLLDTYCWIHTTFSLESAWKKRVGSEVPYPGVDKSTPNEKRVYHAYYQWVCFVLFFQGLMFYVPRYIWKNVEAGKINKITLDLNSPIMAEEKKAKNRGLLVDYLHLNQNSHNSKFILYVLTEVMNFFNVILQMMIIDSFLGGQFTSYGWEVISFSEWDWNVRYDPMIKVFPRLTKCTFHRYGSSGDVQRHDAMCILPINIINEKIYIFLWFWFYFLAIVSFIALIYRAVILFFPSTRIMATQSHCRVAKPEALRSVIKQCRVGDWFVLDLLAKNLDPLNFRDVINDLQLRLDGKGANGI